MLDTTLNRVRLYFSLASLTAVGTVVALVYLILSMHIEARLGFVLHRETSSLSYLVRFKLPSSLLAAVGAAQASGPPTKASSALAASVPVLLYHGEGGGPSMSTATFVAQMRALHDAGWRTISMEQFEAFMRGQATVPDKSFLLTFDDGRTDTFFPADPVLKDLGYTAVMFVITGLSLASTTDTTTGSFYLNTSQLAFMDTSGRWQLESHGDMDHSGYEVPTATSTATSLTMIPSTHFLSNLFWLPAEGRLETPDEYQARIESDLATAKEKLTQGFGKDVIGYAYPFNDFGKESVNFPRATSLIDAVVQKLYDYAFYQTWAGNGDSFNYPDPSTHLVKRIEPAASWSGETLLATLDGARAKTLPYKGTSYFGADWQANWGSITTGNSLRLAATDITTGASAFLDGTENWSDYALTATAEVAFGSIELVARHTETANPYLVCVFSSDRIYLEEHTGTSQSVLATAHYAPPRLPAIYNIGMSVHGSDVSCSGYGIVASAHVPDVPPKGGVGISIWDPENGQAGAAVVGLSVQPL